MALSQTSVLKLYKTVIEDVISGMKDSFLDEGVDEQVLLELKQIWESKLQVSKAVEVNPEPPEPQPPQLPTHKNVTASKAANLANHFAHHQMAAAVTAAQSQTQSQPATQITTPQTHTQSQTQPQQQHQHQHQHQQQQQQQQQQQLAQPPPLQLPQPQSQTIRTAPQQTTSVPIQQHTSIPVQQVITAPAALFERQVPIQITLPGNASTGDGKPKILSIQVPASAIQGNQLHTILTGNIITAAMNFPENVASRLLQQHVDKTLQGQAALASIEINQSSQVNPQAMNMFRQDFSNSSAVDNNKSSGNIAQLDGQHGETSDDDDDDDEDDNDDDDEDLDDKDEEEQDDSGAREEEPLNSEDDVTDDDPTDLFDTDNVVVCQYDKITRSRNKWKFYLKDGIMNLNGKDYVFQKANGDAEW